MKVIAYKPHCNSFGEIQSRIHEVEVDLWRHYYVPTLELIRSDPEHFERIMREPLLMPVEPAYIKIGIHPVVLRQLMAAQWESARRSAEVPEIRETEIPYQADGIAVVAGEELAAAVRRTSRTGRLR